MDIVKSAVRSSMTSERLEDFILISSEKTVLDSIKLAVIVDKFAATARALLLFDSRNHQTVYSRSKASGTGYIIRLRVKSYRLTLLILVTW